VETPEQESFVSGVSSSNGNHSQPNG
jgi:hypothetical protein